MLRFVDGFSHYTDAFLEKKWDLVRRPTGMTAATMVQSKDTVGRTGPSGTVSGGVTFAVSNDDVSSARTDTNPGTQVNQFTQKNFSGQSVIHVGLAIKQNALQLARGGRLLTFLDGATVQLGIDIMPSGQLRYVRGTLDEGIYLVSADPSFGESALYTVLATTANSILSNSFDFLQFKITFNNGAGIVEVKRGDGSTFETTSNLNTAPSGANRSASVLVGGYAGLTGGSAQNVENHYLRGIVCDFHLLDTVAGVANDPITFIGDRHWEVVLPTADATYAQFTPTPSANHWENVDEIPPDGITSNNSTGTLNNKDSMLFQDLSGPSTASVLLSYTMYLEKDAGAAGVSGLMRSPAGGGGTDGTGEEVQAPSPFAFKQSFLFTDPATAAPLTVAIVNAGEHGYTKSG